MNFFRRHWFDIGGMAGIIILTILFFSDQGLSNYQLLMWLSLISLFFHQVEEYRFPGTFPGMINRAMFNSDLPDRYPLNPNTSLIVNVGIGWSIYLLAALAGDKLVWLGMTAILVSLGNIVAHTLIFNIKGKTLYNAGLITCWLFLAPCVFYFFTIVHRERLATEADYVIGISLGIITNIFGVLKPIQWLADKNTAFIFKPRQVLPKDR